MKLFKLGIASLAFIVVGSADAKLSFQDETAKPKTRKECVELAKEKLSDPIEMSTHASKELLQLIKDLETETDPDKRKELEAKKKEEMEKFLEKMGKLINVLCDRLIKQ